MQETDVIYILHYNQSFLLCFPKVHRSSWVNVIAMHLLKANGNQRTKIISHGFFSQICNRWFWFWVGDTQSLRNSLFNRHPYSHQSYVTLFLIATHILTIAWEVCIDCLWVLTIAIYPVPNFLIAILVIYDTVEIIFLQTIGGEF